MATVDVKKVKPYGGMYSDENGTEYYKSADGTIYCQVDGEWHVCTDEGEPDYPTHDEVKITESGKAMRHIKLFENFKSDEDIAKEFDGMKLQSCKLEARPMDYMYAAGTFQGDLVWEFPDGDEHVGGGSTETSEDFVYNVPGKAFQYQVDAWYPDEVYKNMCELIKAELKKKYNAEFEYLRNNEFIKMFDK